jgi:hypothetical protein
MLTVDEATSDSLSFSISGTLEHDTTGDEAGYLAIKSNFSGSPGVNVDWIVAPYAIMSSSISFLNISEGLFGSATAGVTWKSKSFGDAIYFTNGTDSSTPLKAGTEVFGSFFLYGTGIFDTAKIQNLELVTGLNYETTDSPSQWSRLEAEAEYYNFPTSFQATTAAVPEPGTIGLISLAGIGAFLFWRRRKKA